MPLKKTLTTAALISSALLLLAGCSAAIPDKASGSSESSTKPSASAAAPVADKPFNASGLLGGNAAPTFPSGDPGKISVVTEGTLVKSEGAGASLMFAFRNNTNKSISHVDFTAVGRVDGKLVGSGKSQGTSPSQIAPGEVGLGYIYFDDETTLPDTGVKYEFKSDALPTDTSSYNTSALKVGEASNSGSSIIGSADNTSKKELVGPYSVQIYCFDGNTIVREITGFAEPDSDLAAGGQVTFSEDLYGTACDTFSVGVSGYFK